ncbi:catecholate siderophore receptor Fiu [Paucibacter sp. TC2R-5]|uniref:catecholate siderophore receptor Fiu n=1 Tax=Paucibacter sp. TC2R-5 TaxID=2893555 RepID=UPI0021E38134|nr:catecholate siderophore receptor Fiu [Paucibacter sp. TC2R-5]MCV2358968.1 catecholate siderophore receptor Fiu [Paucibacter sp. TC2R-5]
MSFIKSRKHAAMPACVSSASSSSSSSSSVASAALLALTLPLGAWAQTPTADSAETALPVVRAKAKAVVENEFKAETASSPKFVKPLLDTPQTVTVINRELIQQQGTSSLSEALRNTPGITFTLGENGNTNTGDTVFMRGFDASANIFVDGVRDLGGITRDTFNVESVEVVKGPSGADNGRGSPNGFINMVSKKPQLRDFAEGSAQVSSGSRVRVTADLNKKLDIGLPGAALRLNVFSDRGNVEGRDVLERNRWGVAPSLTLGLGTATRATLSYLHVDQDAIPDGGIPGVGLMGWTNQLIFKDLAGANAKPPVGGVLASGIKPVERSNFYGSKDDFDNTQADMLTLLLEHDFAPGTSLRNISRFGRTQQDLNLTNIIISSTPGNWSIIGDAAKPAAWTVGRARLGRDQRNQILANQTSLNSAFTLAGLKNSISTGVELTHEKQNTAGFAYVNIAGDRANLYAPSVNDKFAPLTRNGASTAGETTTAAAFLFDTLDLSERWQLSAGLRAERFRSEYTSIPATSTPAVAASALVNSDTLLSGKLGLLFKPSENGSVYLSYATSQKPPGSDNFALSSATPSADTGAVSINAPNLKPQQANNLELGTKWDMLDKQLLLTAALFRSQNENELARAGSATGEVTQYGKKTVKGLELGAAGAVSNNLQLQAGLVWMDSKVNEAVTVVPGQVDVQTGAQLVYTPKLSFTSWVNYRVAEGLMQGLSLGGGARYTASQTTQVNNGAAPVVGIDGIPSYWVFDAMAAYEINKNLALQFNVANLADKFYLASVNSGRNRFTLGAPRSMSLALNVKY